jgi:hypothetical protein
LFVALGLAGPVGATHPEIQGDGLDCEVFGNSVALRWNIQFIVGIEGWVLCRDGVDIARLSPDTIAYRDISVENGHHFYVLKAINRGGDVLRIAACVVVVGDFDLSCRVDVDDAHLQWFPPIIDSAGADVAFGGYIIRRDGEVIGRVPSDVYRFHDPDLEPGTYRYTVHGYFLPGHEFIVGACTVRIREFRFICRVDPPRVHLDWSRIPVIEIVHYFAVLRDGRLIARTVAASYVDEPGPGEHHYEVFFVAGPRPDVEDEAIADARDTAAELSDREHFKIGECTIVMPGDGPPPPEDLTCVDLDAPEDFVLADAELLHQHDVLLVWQKPVEYDRVLIVRDDERVAVIDGSQFYYIDRDVTPGEHVYHVFGIVDGLISRPAECIVVIPGPEIRPPRDLTCVYVGPREPVDPEDPDAIGGGAGGVVGPTRYVNLSWVNGQRYNFIVVVINNHVLVRIPGSETSYRHVNPTPGRNSYQIFGVVGLRRSESAECSVRVPPVGPPPPVQNLQCVVLHPVPDRDVAEPVDPNVADVDVAPRDPDEVLRLRVLLRWQLPRTATMAAVYDRIIITRNEAVIATLPGSATSYVDNPPFVSGEATYCVIGVVGSSRSEATCCDVDLGPTSVPPPLDLECVVIERVLTPEERDDPIFADVDASIPVPVVRLSWINPIRYARINIARDGEVIARLPGSATNYFDVNPRVGVHVYSVWGVDGDGNASRRVSCEIVIEDGRVPPVRDLTCVAVQPTDGGLGAARLAWVNGADDYTAILVVRNGDEAFRLAGDATGFVDRDLGPGVYEYEVTPIRGNRRGPTEGCRVAIDGEPPENILYFSSGVFEESPDDNLPVRVDGSGRVTCMASNSDPVQGWSFGVCSDPSVLRPAAATIDGTTAGEFNGGRGPSFLVIDRSDDGFTMAAIIDDSDTSSTLPPGTRHSLLRLAYEPGPDAQVGVRYPVRYCDTLGRPPVAVLYVVRGFEVRPRTWAGTVEFPAPSGPFFLRGDANGDNSVGMADAQTILSYLFVGGEAPDCLESADSNGSKEINIADGVYLLQWEFLGGPQPPAPFPRCDFRELCIGCENPTCPQPEF